MGAIPLADRSAEVLVVGAGPTGLVLALWLKRQGVDVRVIDKTAEPGTTSRALVVHARTLELYRQMGLADDVVNRGLEFSALNLWVRGRHAARAALGDIGRGQSPYPYMVIFPQDQHERLLIEHLRRAGVEVERRTTLLAFEERDGHVTADLEAPDGTRVRCRSSYLAGCDGAHSRVREVLGIGFPGGTYERLFYVADVEVRGPVANHELHVALDEADLLAVFPMKGDNVARLIGTVRADSEARDNLAFRDVNREAFDRLQVEVDRVNWFSTYRVHHRVAHRFGRGRAFLVGDAAHIHSPVGGQGMNTGIGDAVNLAWKLSAVRKRRAESTLLATYEPERMAFAERLVATTDRAFTLVTRDGWVARRVRTDVIPRVLPTLLDSTAIRRFIFRTVSQTMLDYRHSSLSRGRAGSVRGGDRLPWVPAVDGANEDNFTPLASFDWQLHVYGSASPELARACRELDLTYHQFPFGPSARASGLAEDATYVVRPDGYVALADPSASPETLRRYFAARHLRPIQSSPAEPPRPSHAHDSRWI